MDAILYESLVDYIESLYDSGEYDSDTLERIRSDLDDDGIFERVSANECQKCVHYNTDSGRCESKHTKVSANCGEYYSCSGR